MASTMPTFNADVAELVDARDFFRLMKYAREIIEDAVRNSSSYADVMRKLEIKRVGGNHGA